MVEKRPLDGAKAALNLISNFLRKKFRELHQHRFESPPNTFSTQNPQLIAKMGVGRRMKKQGPPEPLDEAHFTNLKRKAGMSVAESRAESQQYTNSKKRRTNGGAEGKGKKNSAGTTSTKGKFTNSLPAQKSGPKKSKKPESIPLNVRRRDGGRRF